MKLGKAKQELEKTLERADRAIAEGRSAVYDLHSSAAATNGLAEAVNEVGNELSIHNAAAFNLISGGRHKGVAPIMRDEISREALSNAFERGRAGHFGLPGMRERAKQIGAELTIWSRPGVGREIELSLAGKIAYSSRHGDSSSGHSNRKGDEK